jgi:hypothetical protein
MFEFAWYFYNTMSKEFFEGLFIGLCIGGGLASWFWILFEEKADEDELKADLALMSDADRVLFETTMTSAIEKADAEYRIWWTSRLKQAASLCLFWQRSKPQSSSKSGEPTQ